MTGVLQHGSCRLFQLLHVTFTERSVDHTCLAETASTDTSTLDFQSDTVLGGLDKRNHWFLNWTVSLVHIHDQLLLDLLGNSWAVGSKGSNGTVFLIGNIIKGWNINSRNLSCFHKEVFPAASCCLIGLICVKKSIIDSLTLSNIKQVEKRGQWLWIICTCTAANDDRT